MLRFTTDACTRRDFFRIGCAPLMGLLSGRSSDAAVRPGAGFGRAKSVILIYASGGQSQLEMWDPKPAAPLDVRGDFSAISTAVPGLAFGEHLPRMARIADRYAVIRSMSHEDLDHGSATYLALTGRYHERRSSNPPPKPQDMPTYGAVLRRVRPGNQFPYDAVHLNAPALVPRLPAPGQNGGLLGRAHDPFVIDDPQRPTGVPGLEWESLPPVQLQRRRSLKQTLDGYAESLSRTQSAVELSGLYGQALELLTNPRYRDAFDLTQEPREVRERYGLHRPGQSCLLARRLVEAGVPWMTVVWSRSNRGQDDAPGITDRYGWDTHNDIFEALKVHLLPRFDETLATLLEDLEARGLLDETLVVCMGEFGRAPKVALEPRFAGVSPGRKHWASVYSVVVAGAGVRGGAVIGESDRWAAEPRTQRYGPWDLAATMFSALGVDPSGHYRDTLDRPFPITVGRPIEELYG